MMEYPCSNCTRVKDPKNCENKLCKDWRAWFIGRWDQMRKNLCAEAQQAPYRETGVALGGCRYDSPHRVREFLRLDPCRRCLYPSDRCHSPCPTKLSWSKAQGEVRK